MNSLDIFIEWKILFGGRDGLIDVETRYGMDGPGFEPWWSGLSPKPDQWLHLGINVQGLEVTSYPI
jgi:hypothetical protein